MSFGTDVEFIKEDLKEDVSHQLEGHAAAEVASVEITKCIKFQKFRYRGEKRPGKKYRDKGFVTLQLNNLKDQVVRVVIMCIDADNPELMHPNGLIGAHCKNGIYDNMYAVTKRVFEIVIPYIRIERTKTNKTSMEQLKMIMDTRVSILPFPYKERSRSQYSNWEKSVMKFKTTKVRLAVFVTLDGDKRHLNGTLHAASNVICNYSEKTMLNIHKLSRYSVPALTGGHIDVFTTENGPDIEPDDYFLQVSYQSDIQKISWKSEEYWPDETDILYKRIVSYKVPPFEPDPDLVHPVTATLHIGCPASTLHCTQTFEYLPQQDNQKAVKTSQSQDDTENHEDQKPGMSFVTNQSFKEITTKRNDETMHIFQPIHLQNSNVCTLKGSALKLENPSTNIASETSSDISNRSVVFPTSNESGVKQMGVSDVQCFCVTKLKGEELTGMHPSNSGQNKQNNLSDRCCMTTEVDCNNPVQTAQSLKASKKSHSITKSDRTVDDQLGVQELPSGTGNRAQNADNSKDGITYFIFDAYGISNSEPFENPATSLHDSKSASFRTASVAQTNPTWEMATSPWQVGDSDSFAADSNHAVKRLKFSK